MTVCCFVAYLVSPDHLHAVAIISPRALHPALLLLAL